MAISSGVFVAIGAIATAVGAIGTGVEAYLLKAQLSSATDAVYASNAYTVQKDLIEVYDQVSHALDDLQTVPSGGADQGVLMAALKRDVTHFDTLIESVHGLQNNGGISTGTWVHILRTMCPNFDHSGYSIKNIGLPATKDACMESQSLWKDKVR